MGRGFADKLESEPLEKLAHGIDSQCLAADRQVDQFGFTDQIAKDRAADAAVLVFGQDFYRLNLNLFAGHADGEHADIGAVVLNDLHPPGIKLLIEPLPEFLFVPDPVGLSDIVADRCLLEIEQELFVLTLSRYKSNTCVDKSITAFRRYRMTPVRRRPVPS